MNFSKMNFKYVLIVMASAAIFSCSKAEDGAIGPIGPAGAIGQTGVAGPEGPAGADGLNGGQDGADGVNGTDGADGQDGADGADGNANIIVSEWIVTEFSATASSFSSFEIIPATLNTNGAILVYGRLVSDPGSDFIVPFPYENANERYSYLVDPSEGTFPNIQFADIRFTAHSVDGSDEIFEKISEVRYVNIPPQPSGKSTIDFNKMTYEEVMDHFEMEY